MPYIYTGTEDTYIVVLVLIEDTYIAILIEDTYIAVLMLTVTPGRCHPHIY